MLALLRFLVIVGVIATSIFAVLQVHEQMQTAAREERDSAASDDSAALADKGAPSERNADAPSGSQEPTPLIATPDRIVQAAGVALSNRAETAVRPASASAAEPAALPEVRTARRLAPAVRHRVRLVQFEGAPFGEESDSTPDFTSDPPPLPDFSAVPPIPDAAPAEERPAFDPLDSAPPADTENVDPAPAADDDDALPPWLRDDALDLPGPPETPSVPDPARPEIGEEPASLPDRPMGFDPEPAMIPDPAAVPDFDPQPDFPPQPGFNPERETPRPERFNSEPESNAEPTPAETILGDGVPERDVRRGPKQPQLKIEKLAPERAVLGKPMVYQILIRNEGNSPADEVTVRDRVPKGTELAGTIPQAELDDTTLIWKLGRLAPGEQKRIAIQVIPREAGKIGSVATVNFVAEVQSETEVAPPVVDLAVSAPRSARVGEGVEVVVTLENIGSEDATDVSVRSLLSKGLVHPAGDDLEYTLDRLAVGDRKSVTLEVQVVADGSQTVSLTLAAEGMRPVEKRVDVDVAGSRLELTRSASKTRYLGRPVVVTNSLRNTSRGPIADSAIVEWLPTSVRFVEASHQGRYDAERHLVVWRLRDLAPDEVREVQLKFEPTEAGRLESRVKAYDPNGSFRDLTSSIQIVGRPALGLTVSDAARPLAVGERMQMKVSAVNRGTDDASSVRLTVTLPDQVDLVDVNAAVKSTQAGRVVTFEPLGALAKDATSDYTLTFEGRRAGEGQVVLSLHGEGQQQPASRSEPVFVFAE